MKQMSLALVSIVICFSIKAAMAYNDALLPQIKQGEPGEKAGEIIAPVTNEEVAAWCDFEKMIIITNRSFLCVFNGKPVP